VERELGEHDPWRFGGTALYSWAENALTYVDARGCAVGANGTADIHDCRPVGFGPDGRPFYNNNAARGNISNTDLVLTNSDEGESLSLAAFGGREISEGNWRGSAFDVSYTYTDAKEVNPLTSSVAFSNYTNIAVSDVNNPGLATSNTEIEHSFKGRASFERRFFGDLATNLTFYAERRSGLPYSYTFNLQASNNTGDPLGATSNRQLIYVPSGDSDPVVGYANAATRSAFLDYVSGSDLADWRGTIAERNAFTSRWVTRIDARLSQELPGLFPNGARGMVYMDILNLANLINPRWGIVDQVEFPFTRPIVNATLRAQGFAFGDGTTCSNAAGCWEYSNFSVPATNLSNSDAPRRSLYQIKIGIRYSF
jgi:hypothetical protein